MRVSFLSAMLFLFLSLNAQEYIFPVKNFTTRDYGIDFHPVNMAVITDHRGIVYAANGFSLLEYDGRYWKSYPINKEAWILSLAVDSNGIVYAGSQGEFGYFAPEKPGRLRYISLSDSLQESERHFTNVWKVHASDAGIVFQAEELIFIYRDKKLFAIKPETSFHTSFFTGKKIFVRQRDLGLYELVGEKLSFVKGSSIFSKAGIFLMIKTGDGNKILIATREKGIYNWEYDDSRNSFETVNTGNDKFIEESQVSGGAVLPDGTVALSTLHNGVLFLEPDLTFSGVLNKETGLADNEVKDLITDINGNLWAALNNGLSYIQTRSPLSFYDASSGLHGSVYAAIRHRGILYAGTSAGLFAGVNSPGQKSFRQAGLEGTPVRALYSDGKNIFAGTDFGLFRSENNEFKQIDSKNTFTLSFWANRNILLAGGAGGLRSVEKKVNNSIKPLPPVEGEDIIGFAEYRNITGNDELWIGTRYNGAIRISVSENGSYESEHFTGLDGLPEGAVKPVVIEGNLLFETGRGLFSFTDELKAREELPDSLKNNPDFARGYFSPVTLSGLGGYSPITSLTETKGKLWFSTGARPLFLRKNDSIAVERPFLSISSGKVYTVFAENDSVAWIGTSDGLIEYDAGRDRQDSLIFSTHIRSVYLPESDSLLFTGIFFTEKNGNTVILPSQPDNESVVLTYKNNTLRFEYSSSCFEYSEKTRFSYLLEGLRNEWSPWETVSRQEFNNLREGKYRFRVKALNVYGTESSEAVYSFTVLPPWYRKWYSYLLYAIVSLFLLWLSAEMYSARLKRENIRLEGIVTERTAEVVRQKDEISNKNIVLEQQKKEIEDSIRYAERIQRAVIPSESVCRTVIPESFIFFRPLSIVSGDFYWISKTERYIVFTAADCTGHGVPGAFMSMLGVAFLNEIVNKDKLFMPDLILNSLREKVTQALQQKGIDGGSRDGMDIALISLDTLEGKLYYAGAYNPLIAVRKKEVKMIQGDKMPIGYHDNMLPFTRHELAVEENDSFYLFSDGFEDQFGGPEGKKFKSVKLRNLLAEISELDTEEQKRVLGETFENWKGELPQIDDVVVAGLRIKKTVSQ